jgi:SAM-dependent methyltransferase
VKNLIKKLYRFIFAKSIPSSCPVCGKVCLEFLRLPDFYKEHLEKHGYLYSFDDLETLNYQAYSCPHCSASDRDRLYALYISKYLVKRSESTNISLLEIAPSKPLTAYLKQTKKISVRTADLMMQGVDDCVDITNMLCYPSNSFDAFICSHVLEHVPNDIKALQELYRILKLGGWGILMVPIPLSLQHIDEDPLLEDVGERWRRFGQDDHIRMYSKNGFVERVEATGFIVTQYGYKYFGLDTFKKHGIAKKSVLYIVKKPELTIEEP